MLGKSEMNSIADRVLNYSRADAAEVVISSKSSNLTRFYRNSVHQNVQEKEARVHLQVWVGNRGGMASTNALNDESLREVADRVTGIARMGSDHSEVPKLSQHAKLYSVAALDPALSDQSPRERAEVVRQVCQAAAERGHQAYGAYLVEVNELAAANSEGHFGHHARSLADFQTVVRSNGASG